MDLGSVAIWGRFALTRSSLQAVQFDDESLRFGPVYDDRERGRRPKATCSPMLGLCGVRRSRSGRGR